MPSKLKLWIFLFSLIPTLLQGSPDSTPDSLLSILQAEILQKDQYVENKKIRVDGLRDSLSGIASDNYSEQYYFCEKILDEYMSLRYDSAFVYAHQLNILAFLQQDPNKIISSRLKISSLFLSGGLFSQALDTLRCIEPAVLTDEFKADYYNLYGRLYYSMAGFISDQHFAPRYVAKGNLYQDSLIRVLPPGSDAYIMAVGKRYCYDHEYQKTIDTLTPLLQRWDYSARSFPILASTLAFCYRSLGRMAEAKEMLMLAVISDIKNVKLESTTSTDLAVIFYKEKEVALAYECIQLAHQCASKFNARHRKTRILETLPSIDTEKIILEQEKQLRTRNFAIVVSLLGLVVVLFLVIIYIQLLRLRRSRKQVQATNRSLEETNLQLKESNLIKDKYILDFLDIYSAYISKMDQQQKQLQKKVREKKFDELLSIINRETIEEERQQFFKCFDTIFLSLFPTFIDDFNQLLQPDGHLVPRKNELLNTELRIYAFMRLGINQPVSIAKFLNCSLNTVYAYKTKINNKALFSDKKDFEEAIMKIGIHLS